MSFSKEVKEELSLNLPRARHCRMAELAGILVFSAKNKDGNENDRVEININDEAVLRKYFTLLDKTLNIDKDVAECDDESYKLIKKTLRISDDFKKVDDMIFLQPCCKRSFIRGAFLAAGSISDPNKGYHFEIVAPGMLMARQLVFIMNTFDVDAKIISRGERVVVYIKDGSQIVEILRIMDASRSVMEIENIRVVKEVRGSINRKVNCETANIGKTVGAAVRQIEDIQLIDEKLGLDTLAESLQSMAQVRLEHPDTPLGDLGQYLDPPIGKSGVNHRLKRLSAIAQSLKDN